MKKRIAQVERVTKETQIKAEINLDGQGDSSIKADLPFLEHMLEQVARHGMFDLTILAKGDLEIDAHHTVEEVGIVLGQALEKALGNKVGITRFGSAYVPLDE
ncbi:MAG: imidazoleglycerol-phosphate dehydratase, partial [Gammaproteobacteria bacterium]|nr:imidazoleglycerol-phosphate dehydratase [Gammaproteobacteria bacterium]